MTGIVRNLEKTGRIVIPKEVRDRLQMKDGEAVTISWDKDTVYIKKFNNEKYCMICNSDKFVKEIDSDKYVCSECIDKITFRSSI